jgi:hypothetical protein
MEFTAAQFDFVLHKKREKLKKSNPRVNTVIPLGALHDCTARSS